MAHTAHYNHNLYTLNDMKNSDKPAFPEEWKNMKNKEEEQEGQMSKREKFAMAAMQGLLSHSKNVTGFEKLAEKKDVSKGKAVAKVSIEIADALLDELEETNE